MQFGGDLENAWNMFDHSKCVEGRTTMAFHVYNPAYCKVLTIILHDMQSKSIKAQFVLWKKMKKVMFKHNLSNINLKEFMADGV
jgi:hypothetical protein